MHCYCCEKSPSLSGVRYRDRHAAGRRDDCGVHLGADHGAKRAGQPLLGGDCEAARRLNAQQGRAA
jgi:hypothetical protein